MRNSKRVNLHSNGNGNCILYLSVQSRLTPFRNPFGSFSAGLPPMPLLCENARPSKLPIDLRALASAKSLYFKHISSMNDPTVFVLDDDELIRRALARLFDSVGLQCRTFDSPEEFLDIDRPDGPCCLVLDVRMSGLSGLEVQRELAAADLDMPVIFMSGHATVPLSVWAMKAGAQDFFEKPVDEQALLDAVNLAIKRDRERRQTDARLESFRQRADSLTPREQQVFELVVSGLLNKQVADRIGTAEKTVKVHRASVMRKMQADSVAELAVMAERLGIICGG